MGGKGGPEGLVVGRGGQGPLKTVLWDARKPRIRPGKKVHPEAGGILFPVCESSIFRSEYMKYMNTKSGRK